MCRAAVHDWSLTGSKLHIDVIDVESCQCGQDMFNCLYLKPIAADCGTKFCRHQMFDRCREGGSVFSISIDKDDARIGYGWSERKSDWLPGMQTNPCTTHWIR